MSKDARVVVDSMYLMHKHATVEMGELDTPKHPISKLSVEKRVEVSQGCAEIIANQLYLGCPRLTAKEVTGCDLNMTVVNLYQALSLAIQVDDEGVFNLLKTTGLPFNQLTLLMGSIGAYSIEHETTFSDCTVNIGPSMFKAFREHAPNDYIVQHYDEAVAHQTSQGLGEPFGGVQRIQFISIIVNNEGNMNSKMLRNCLAIAIQPDYSSMVQVKTYTKHMSKDLYDHFEESPDGEKLWLNHQVLLQDCDKKVARELKNMHKCNVCDKGGPQRCSICHKTYYCSSECQQRDWKEHKKTCVKV